MPREMKVCRFCGNRIYKAYNQWIYRGSAWCGERIDGKHNHEPIP